MTIRPLQVIHRSGAAFEEGRTYSFRAGGTITANDVVYVNGISATAPNTGIETVVRLDADALATSKGLRYVALTAAASGDEVLCVPVQRITGVNTNSATAALDPVWLSGTAGGWSVTRGSFGRQVGVVLVKSATVGEVLLAPQVNWSERSGLLSAITAAGTAHTASITEAKLATATIPAGQLTAGAVIRIIGSCKATATNGTDTLTANVRISNTDNAAGTAVMTTAATDVADNDVVTFDLTFTFRDTPAANADYIVTGFFSEPAAPGAGTVKPIHSLQTGSTGLDTSAAVYISLTADWSSNSASNSVQAESFVALLFVSE